ncbi:MAG: sodium/proline symporter PutP [Legionellales bacterium]|nr:sodium/proline symporter PutP [Legionellales bacterium]
MSLVYLITFIVYFLTVLTIAAVASRYTHDTEDFVLGGRRLGSWIVAFGAGASDMSGWLLLGLPGTVYVFGIDQIWLPLGLILGALVNWTTVAKRLRVYTKLAKNSLTIPSFFENRFHDKTGILRLVTSAAIITFFTFYVSSGFVSGAVLFQSTFHLSYYTALFVGAAVIIGYTCVGGFLAVNWIDLFQGCLMWLALMAVPAVTLFVLFHVHPNLIPLHSQLIAAISHRSLGIIAIISLLAWGLGYFGQPHILVRFMAAKEPNQLRRSTWICMIWMTMSLMGAVLTGIVGRWYFSAQPLANPESVFLSLAQELFNPWIAGVLLAAVLSAVMSTIAAQLLASSSSLAEDVYFRFFVKDKSAKQGLLTNRTAVLLIAAVALFFARSPNSTVLALVSYAWAGLGASFGPLMLCSLFWSRTTRNGGIAGIVVGGLTVIIWKQLAFLGGIFGLYEIFPAFFFGLLAIIIVSLIDNPPPDSVIEEFRQFKAELRHGGEENP